MLSLEQYLAPLSVIMKKEILTDIFGRSLRNIWIFKKYFSKNSKFLEQLSFIMRETLLGPGDVIIKQKKIDVPKIYFIEEGEVELFIETGLVTNR